MKQKITESEFYMWRCLFAMAHADNVVTDEEVRYMAEVMEDVPFNEEQQRILNDDIKNAKDIVEMFEGITEGIDQARFFRFAQELVWVDGDYGKEEQEIMLKLKEAHIRKTNIDDLVGKVELELDEFANIGDAVEKPTKKQIIFSFREQFFKNR